MASVNHRLCIGHGHDSGHSLGHGDDGTYTYASQPRRARTCYRDDLGSDETVCKHYGNIMYDRRVVRGITYASHGQHPSCAAAATAERLRIEAARRARARRLKCAEAAKLKEPPEPRDDAQVQTELYLEELVDHIDEFDVGCQTDEMLDRPLTPLYVPAKTGYDVATQIYEGDLFHFDIEVVPILEVLVGKTTEQSLLEVLEEEELANLRQQQRMFEELRNVDMAEQERLEEQDRRIRQEKAERIKQEQLAFVNEREARNKMASHAYAQSFLVDLVPTVYGLLSFAGYFHDPIEREIEQQFLPWLMDHCVSRLRTEMTARVVLDEIIRLIIVEKHRYTKWLDTQIQFTNEAYAEAELSPPSEDDIYPHFFTDADHSFSDEEDEEEEDEEEEDEEEEEETEPKMPRK